MREHAGVNDTLFDRRNLQYDTLSRLTATWHDTNGLPVEQNRGEHFWYDQIGQLTHAVYNAQNAQTTTPVNAVRDASYNLDALNRTGANAVNANGMQTAYTPNAMNQYSSVGGQSLTHTTNFSVHTFSGSTYVYDADQRMTSASAPGQTMQFVYDGLGVRETDAQQRGHCLHVRWVATDPGMERERRGAGVERLWRGPGRDSVAV